MIQSFALVRASRLNQAVVSLAAWTIVGLIALSPSLGAADLNNFRFVKDVQRSPATREEVLAVILDSEVYAETRNGTPDIRIADPTGAEVPYQREAAADRREIQTLRATRANLLSLHEDGAAIELRVRREKDAPAVNGIRFKTPLLDFQRTVRVSGSSDGISWAPLVQDALIFDYRRFADLRHTDVTLPANDFHEFKIVVEQAVDERESPFRELTRTIRDETEQQRVERTAIERRPFRIDRIELLQVMTAPSVNKFAEQDYPPAAFRVERDAKKKRTIVHVTTYREPLTGFEIQTASRNFYRPATVQVPDSNELHRWVAVGSANIMKLDFRNTRHAQLLVPFDEQQHAEYQIVIDDQDNPPLEITGVMGKGPVYRAVFLAAPGQAYRLFYGSESAQLPKYDTSTVLGALRFEMQAVETKLGPQRENGTFGGEPGMLLSRLLADWRFLGVAITIAALVLAWALYRAGRKMEILGGEKPAEKVIEV